MFRIASLYTWGCVIAEINWNNLKIKEAELNWILLEGKKWFDISLYIFSEREFCRLNKTNAYLQRCFDSAAIVILCFTETSSAGGVTANSAMRSQRIFPLFRSPAGSIILPFSSCTPISIANIVAPFKRARSQLSHSKLLPMCRWEWKRNGSR